VVLKLLYVPCTCSLLFFLFPLPLTFLTGGQSIFSDAPLKRGCLCSYFEVSILSTGRKGSIAVGLGERAYPNTRFPGQESNSIGYNGEDGSLMHGCSVGESFGPPLNAGDVIGCGLNYAKNRVIFTCNGLLLPTTEALPEGLIYAIVGLNSIGQSVQVNFGNRDRPFLFSLGEYEGAERRRLMGECLEERVHAASMYTLVCDYLRHAGYAETLRLLESSKMKEKEDTTNSASTSTIATTSTSTIGSTVGQQAKGTKLDLDSQTLNGMTQVRVALMTLVLEGQITTAFQLITTHFPGLFPDQVEELGMEREQPSSAFTPALQTNLIFVKFMLHSQQVVEWLTEGKVEAAVVYARQYLAPFRRSSWISRELLEDVMRLVAFPELHQGHLGVDYLQNRRQDVATLLNSVIMVTSGSEAVSGLERICKQIVACHWGLRHCNEDRGELFRWNLLED
jgi:hypothetical protein